MPLVSTSPFVSVWGQFWVRSRITVGEHGSNPFVSLPRMFLGSLFQALLLWGPLCPLNDFTLCVSMSWWFWPHTRERELRLRLHSKTHERLLGKAGGGGSWWHFVISVSPIICLSLACLVHWVIAWQLWLFRRCSVWLKGNALDDRGGWPGCGAQGQCPG